MMGYKGLSDYIVRLVVPITIGMLLMFIILTIIGLPLITTMIAFLAGMSIIFFYPMITQEKIKADINQNLHFFITYAGTIATMKVSRDVLFKRIAEKQSFGEISKVAEKIRYLAKEWNMGFSLACRKIGEMVPSKILADFFDRFAVMMDFGQDLEVFLLEEQDSIMDDYETEYKKSLENIKMVETVFTSLTVALSFLIAIALLMPLLMEMSMELIVRYALLGVIFVDILLLTIVKAAVPNDKIAHTMKIKSEGMKKMEKVFLIIFPLTITLLLGMIIFSPLPIMVNIAIGISPMMIIGVYARNEEENIKTRDNTYPTLIRTLGSAIEARSGGVVSALYSLRVHHFGLMDPLVLGLYRRLRIGSDKIKAWSYFSGESGSHMIHHFTRIFSEAIYLGGKAEKIGEILAKNFYRILALRKQRLHLASALRGAMYGSLIGLTTTVYMSAQIANILANIFTQPLGENVEMDIIVAGLVPEIAIADMATVSIYIGIMVIVHAFISTWAVNMVDGGMKLFFFDFIIMIWIGALISVVVPMLTGYMMPTLGLEGFT